MLTRHLRAERNEELFAATRRATPVFIRLSRHARRVADVIDADFSPFSVSSISLRECREEKKKKRKRKERRTRGAASRVRGAMARCGVIKRQQRDAAKVRARYHGYAAIAARRVDPRDFTMSRCFFTTTTHHRRADRTHKQHAGEPNNDNHDAVPCTICSAAERRMRCLHATANIVIVIS